MSKLKRKQPSSSSSKEINFSQHRNAPPKDEFSTSHYPYHPSDFHQDSMPYYSGMCYPTQALMPPLPLPPSQNVYPSHSFLNDPHPALRGFHNSYHNPHHSYSSVYAPGIPHAVPPHYSNVSHTTNCVPDVSPIRLRSVGSTGRNIHDQVSMSTPEYHRNPYEITSNIQQDNISHRQEGVQPPMIHRNETMKKTNRGVNTNSSNSSSSRAVMKNDNLEDFVSGFFSPPSSPDNNNIVKKKAKRMFQSHNTNDSTSATSRTSPLSRTQTTNRGLFDNDNEKNPPFFDVKSNQEKQHQDNTSIANLIFSPIHDEKKAKIFTFE